MDNFCPYFWSRELGHELLNERFGEHSVEEIPEEVRKEVDSRTISAMDMELMITKEPSVHVARIV